MSENKTQGSGAGPLRVPGIKVEIYLPKGSDKSHGTLLGRASVNLGSGLSINNVRIYNNKNGRFVYMPSMISQDGRACCPITWEMRQTLNAAVLDAYQKKVEREHHPSVCQAVKNAAKKAAEYQALAPECKIDRGAR